MAQSNKIKTRDMYFFRHCESINNRIQMTSFPFNLTFENSLSNIEKLNPFVSPVTCQLKKKQLLELLQKEQKNILEMGYVSDPMLTINGQFQASTLWKHPVLAKAQKKIDFYGRKGKILVLVSPTLRTLETSFSFVSNLQNKYPLCAPPLIVPLLCEKGGGFAISNSRSSLKSETGTSGEIKIEKDRFLTLDEIRTKYPTYVLNSDLSLTENKHKKKKHTTTADWWHVKYNTVERKNSQTAEEREEIEKMYQKRIYATKQWLLSVITDSQSPYDLIFVFSHGDFLSGLISQFVESPAKNVSFQLTNAAVTHFEFQFPSFPRLSPLLSNLNFPFFAPYSAGSLSAKFNKKVEDEPEKEEKVQDSWLYSFSAPPSICEAYEKSSASILRNWWAKTDFRICIKGVGFAHIF